ncbi:MAG: hypothetical protein IJ523_06110 [Succinivibrionaceae bacterium]|nr:hypothetical protein [Succinivibrionaceae bacterium]
MKEDELNSFSVSLSSSDRRLIDLSVLEIIKAVTASGAQTRGPFLRRNFVKDDVLYHYRRIKVFPTADTASKLDGINLSKEVTVQLFRD